MAIAASQIQNHQVLAFNLRQAYHDLIDPPFGFRLGTQFKFLDVDVQIREQQLKLAQFDILSVNSYHPISAFKMPLSWGFDLSWQQEALNQGKFSDKHQHGVANFNTQFGLSIANEQHQHLCYAQLQNHLQVGKALADDWRFALGPVFGCQQIWTDQWNSVWHIQLPYWSDLHQWQFKTNVEIQYALNAQDVVRVAYHYEQQKQQHWDMLSLKFIHFF